MSLAEKQVTQLRGLPAVDRVLEMERIGALVERYGRALVVEGVRAVIEGVRASIVANEGYDEGMDWGEAVADWLEGVMGASLVPVINGTGVIVHTNLGRAPLSGAAVAAMAGVAEGYSNLEYDLERGVRGSRTTHGRGRLQRLTGAEAALVVNNTAAAVLLMLSSLAQGKEVIISRGQLVEIGGGFRVPDVLAQSGAILVEVGTTNRTHLRDYEAAITENTAAILVVHQSNYKVVGFTHEPALGELAALAHHHGFPLWYDQGSGALLDTSVYGLAPEPTVGAGIEAGCDLVTFSGDKLLGGPQAGIVVGRADLVARMGRHPLARAVRADKLCLAGLEATLAAYEVGRVEAEVPVWQMIGAAVADIRERAERWAAAWAEVGGVSQVIDGWSTVGGGSLPGTQLATVLVGLVVAEPDIWAARLRQNQPAIITRIQDDLVCFDPRTVLPHQDERLVHDVKRILAESY
ncbi:MAG TPA: L-seryl-tRNA(Sec) selenium transferase [Anaerolineae bacterium]|nr:L-seryl-tRNA(Sec) selenium transferase [Anaerolineae bacterium]